MEGAAVVAVAVTWPASGSRPHLCQLSRLRAFLASLQPLKPEALTFTSPSESSFFEGRLRPRPWLWGISVVMGPPPIRCIPFPPRRPVTEVICCF